VTTGFTDHSYVGAVGITAATFAFVGYEASAHMAEETGNARTAASKGIVNTVLCTGVGGLFIYFAFLFSMNAYNIDQVAYDDDAYAQGGPVTGNSAVNLFVVATKHTGPIWAQALTWLVVINLFFAGMSSVTVTGRITFALARDGAFPASAFFASVNETTKSPINALLLVLFFDCGLLLLPLIPNGGDLAFSAIIGLCVIGFQMSYAIPIFLKVIYKPTYFPVPKEVDLGSWSKPLGIISTTWLCATSILLFLPTASPISLNTFNWYHVVHHFPILCSIYTYI